MDRRTFLTGLLTTTVIAGVGAPLARKECSGLHEWDYALDCCEVCGVTGLEMVERAAVYELVAVKITPAGPQFVKAEEFYRPA